MENVVVCTASRACLVAYFIMQSLIMYSCSSLTLAGKLTEALLALPLECFTSMHLIRQLSPGTWAWSRQSLAQMPEVWCAAEALASGQACCCSLTATADTHHWRDPACQEWFQGPAVRGWAQAADGQEQVVGQSALPASAHNGGGRCLHRWVLSAVPYPALYILGLIECTVK